MREDSIGDAVPNAPKIAGARSVLAAHLPVTRLVRADTLSKRLDAPVWLKLESDLPTGSFKPRGALYALASRQRRGKVSEVVASSTGNHGAAVAYAAAVLGVRATIFLPEQPNPVKRARIAELGADIVERGRDLSVAAAAARDHSRSRDSFLLDDATDPDVPVGAGTVAAEILEQAADAAQIFVPMGDTALIRGVAAYSRATGSDIRVIGVQASRAPAYALSYREGRVVQTASCETIADGLATRIPQAANVAAIRELVDDVVLVEEVELLDAIRTLLAGERVVAEPAGAAATAAALAAERLDRPTVLLVTGGNLTEEVLQAAVCRSGSSSAGRSPAEVDPRPDGRP